MGECRVMKNNYLKKVIGFLILTIVIILGIILSYLWIVNPLSYSVKRITYEKSNLIQRNLNEISDIYNNNYNGELPSDNYEDYRTITLDGSIAYRSAIMITGLSAYPCEFESENASRIVSIQAGTFADGESYADRFCNKEIAELTILIYTGDCSSEDEVEEIVKDIIDDCKIKVIYSMQWIGDKTTTVTLDADEIIYKFIDFDK